MSNDPCTLHQDGICALHGHEVERRENMVGKLNWVLGVLSVVMALVLGSFSFTAMVRSDLKELTEKVSGLNDSSIRTEVELKNITGILELMANHTEDKRRGDKGYENKDEFAFGEGL